MVTPVVWDPTGQISIDMRIAVRGMAWKYPCIAASLSNINLAAPGASIDGRTMAAGDHFGAFGQSTGSQNGLWVWHGAATPATRAPDMDQDQTTDVKSNETLGAVVYVIDGTVNGGKFFYVTNTATPVIGTTTLVWAEFTGSGGNPTDGLVPYYIAVADSYTVPLYKQALFSETIENDGALIVNGMLIGVD